MTSSFYYRCPSSLLERAADRPPARVGVVAAGAITPMQSARLAVQHGLVEPVLIGEEGEIEKQAAELEWDISGLEIVSASGAAACAAAGVALAARGAVSILMKGQLHTDIFMQATLARSAGLRTGRRFTHIFHMTGPMLKAPLLISDAALNIAPDVTKKCAIIENALAVADGLGLAAPKIALLSATEEQNPAIPSSIEAALVVEKMLAQNPDLLIGGPFAMDNAISLEAAQIKGISHPVAGMANLLIVPDLVCGNILFKTLVFLMGSCAAGLVVGAKVPIIVTSRADPPEARLASLAVAVILAGHSMFSAL